MSAAREYGLDDDYEWARPPDGGWIADDLDHLPNLPSHTELIDGSLVFRRPQNVFHLRTVRLLEYAILHQTPEQLEALAGMTVELDRRNRPDPDVIVVQTEANTGPHQTWYKPEDIVLAVEVVSDDTVERDREVKPRKYAQAGVTHFWRAEENEDLPVVYAYELDPATRGYALVGIFRKALKVDLPFPIEIDLTAINRRPSRRAD
ncbi:Uma2 family endonuclease [Streptomyces violascens]|uniref:Uma2 family endonuclease n=1 Tax=Streptomyces violascens TaxID=67381 RepID=UPI00364F8A70